MRNLGFGRKALSRNTNLDLMQPANADLPATILIRCKTGKHIQRAPPFTGRGTCPYTHAAGFAAKVAHRVLARQGSSPAVTEAVGAFTVASTHAVSVDTSRNNPPHSETRGLIEAILSRDGQKLPRKTKDLMGGHTE